MMEVVCDIGNNEIYENRASRTDIVDAHIKCFLDTLRQTEKIAFCDFKQIHYFPTRYCFYFDGRLYFLNVNVDMFIPYKFYFSINAPIRNFYYKFSPHMRFEFQLLVMMDKKQVIDEIKKSSEFQEFVSEFLKLHTKIETSEVVV